MLSGVPQLVGVCVSAAVAAFTAIWKLASLIKGMETALVKEISALRTELAEEIGELKERVAVVEVRQERVHQRSILQ